MAEIVRRSCPTFPAADQDRSTVKMTKESLQLNVLISGGFAGAYEQLLPQFQRMSGLKVTTGSGASQGSGPQTIAAQSAAAWPLTW